MTDETNEGPENDEPGAPLSPLLKGYYLYQTFAVLWVFPALGGLVLLWPARRLDWSRTNEALEKITLEQWLGLLLVGMEFMFAYKTWEYARALKAERREP